MEQFTGVPRNCSTCAISYICEEQAECYCKDNNYRDYHGDSQLIARYMERFKPTLLQVICSSPRETNPYQLRVGDKYFIDKASIYIDGDGDAYGAVFKTDGQRVGNLKLSHFRGDL